MWEFIFGMIVGSIGTIVLTVMVAAVATYSAFDADRVSERNNKR